MISKNIKYTAIKKSLLSVSLVGVATTSFVIPSGAYAQPLQELKSLDEIIVTARRRDERIQDVPITVNLFDDEYLRTNNIVAFDDLQYHTPSMNITYNGSDTLEPRVSIRGVKPYEARIVDDPSTPIYISDVVMTPSAGLNLALYDLGSVQVLKGPQGTLFGRNSTAGAILIMPKLPGDIFGGYINGTVGNYDLYKADFGVDIPISDDFQLRLAGTVTDRDGYQTNKNILPGFETEFGKKLWDDDTKSFRIVSLWRPADSLENVTIVEWGEKDAMARASKAVVTGRPENQPSIDRSVALRNPMDVINNVLPEERVEHLFVANTTTWNLEYFDIKNIFGYRAVETFRRFDLDGSDLSVAQSRADGSGDVLDADQYSNELQLLGTAFQDKLDWVVGVYFYTMEGDTTQNSISRFGTAETTYNKSTSYAFFGQGTYDFSDSWALTLGARQSWDERDIRISSFFNISENDPTCGLVDSGPGCRLSDSEKFSSTTWDVSVKYTFNDRAMAYLAVGSGYKSGGFNARASTAAALSPFDEETVTSYELGMKADWNLGQALVRSNLSVFYMDYQDLQVSVSECIDLGGPSCTIVANKNNAGQAEFKGVELQLSLLPSDNLTIDFGYSHVDSKYIKWDSIDGAGNYRDQSDTLFSLQPENEFNASIQYTLALKENIGSISFMTGVSWRDKQYLSEDPAVYENPAYDGYLIQDSYHLVNFRVDWKEIVGSGFDLSFFINNLENKTYVTARSDQLREGRGLYMAHVYGEPRTYGASLRYSF